MGRFKMHKIVIPYYGSLWRPGFGQEQCFFVLAVRKIDGLVEKIEMRVSAGRTPQSLTRWLSDMRVDGVLCADACLAEYAERFETQGIWVRWHMSGDLSEMVAAWWDERQPPARAYESYQMMGGML